MAGRVIAPQHKQSSKTSIHCMTSHLIMRHLYDLEINFLYNHKISVGLEDQACYTEPTIIITRFRHYSNRFRNKEIAGNKFYFQNN